MAITYKKLWSDYNRFDVPAAEIKINGKDLMKSGTVTEIIVTVSSDPEANSAEVEILSDDNALDSLLQIGVKAEISLGYEEKTALVFTGYLHSLSVLQSGAGTAYRLICLDCKGLMALGTAIRIEEKKKLSAIISGILSDSRYSGFYGKKILGKIPSCFDLPYARAGESEFDFLCGWAELLDFRFFTAGETLFFAAENDLGAVKELELEQENGIFSSETISSLSGQVKKAAAVSFDDCGKRIFSNKPRAGEKGAAAGKLSSVTGNEAVFLYTDFKTKEQLDILSAARMREMQRKFCTLEAACIGLPELLPPNKLAYDGGKWIITEAAHILSRLGYRTKIKAFCDYN